MALSGAEKTARYRARHPERVSAYEQSERGREVGRVAQMRYRLGHPQPRKLPRVRVTAEQKAQRNRVGQRRFIAKTKGYAPLDETTVLPKPDDSRCNLCSNVSALHVDHDHETGKFRGWLCIQCNMGIGQLGDTIESLERALRYLRGAR